MITSMINAKAVQATEVRVLGWTYRAEVLPEWKPSYVGAARVTRYYRFNGKWESFEWNQLPASAYRALRAGIRRDARGPIE